MSQSDSSPEGPWSHDFHYVLNRELDLLEKEESQPTSATESRGPATPRLNLFRRLGKKIAALAVRMWNVVIGIFKAPAAPNPEKACAEPDAIARAHAKELVGLAFSGGGIRSATFNLGVLQSLARMGLLSKFDYLSTVSAVATSEAGSWRGLNVPASKMCGPVFDPRGGNSLATMNRPRFIFCDVLVII